MKDNEIIKSLEKIYSVSEDTHSIYTPLDLCEEMINSISKLEGDILVISNLEFLITLKRNGVDMNTVHYSVNCHYKKRVAVQLGLDLNNIYQLDYNSKEIDLGIEDMKFDVIVMNPPYGKLHLPFLELSTKLRNDGGEIISIQPIDKLQVNVSKKDFSWLKPEHIKIINAEEATKLFNAKFISDLGIIHITDNHNFDISELKYYNNYYNNINKLRKKSLHEHYIYSKDNVTNHFVEFALTHGHSRALDEYELFSATKMEVNKECKGLPNKKRRLYFNTKIEAENFIKSCRNITYYFIRKIVFSTPTTIPMRGMPFMGDYTKVYTDKDYCDYFNLDYDIVKKEMSKYIKQVKKSYPDYEPNI